VDEPSGSTKLSGTILDSRGLALERAARKGEAQEGPNNPALARCIPSPTKGALRIWRSIRRRHVAARSRGTRPNPPLQAGEGARRECRSHSWLVRIRDSRRLAPKRAARRGLAHGWAKQSPCSQYAPYPQGAFCVSGGPLVVVTSPRDQERPHPSPPLQAGERAGCGRHGHPAEPCDPMKTPVGTFRMRNGRVQPTASPRSSTLPRSLTRKTDPC
jgi:hypothetical protein